MKKGIVLLLMLSLLVLSVAGALAVEAGGTVSALEGGVGNIDFGDSLYGFCFIFRIFNHFGDDRFRFADLFGCDMFINEYTDC